MEYQTSAMTTVSECSAAIEEITGVKSALLTRKSFREFYFNASNAAVTTTAQELQEVRDELAAKLIEYEQMPEGREKRDLKKVMLSLETQEINLLNRSENRGGFSRIEKQMAMEVIDFKVLRIDDAVTQITARRTELELANAA